MNKPAVLLLIPNMAGGIKSLFDQLLVLGPGNGQLEFIAFASHGDHPLSILLFPARLVRFALILKRRKIALCHINLSLRGSTLRKLIYARLCRLLGVSYVIHLHGSGYDAFYWRLPSGLQKPVRQLFHKAAKVIVLGQVWRDFAIQVVDMDRDRVCVLANAVLGPDRLVARDKAKTMHILFLGALGQRKGTPELIRALASTQMRTLKWRATLAGNGDVRRARDLAIELGIADRIYFPGWINASETRLLLADGDILVLPSHAENLPLSMLEGMAYGLCAIVTPVGAVTDVIRDGENGLLVTVGDAADLANAMASVIKDPQLCQSLGKKGRADFLEHFDMRNYRSGLERIHLKILHHSQV